MKYRVIESEDEITVFTEDGYVGEVRWAEPIDADDDRQSTIEWYDQSILNMIKSPLRQVLECTLEDLPKYLNEGDELVQEVLKARFAGEQVEDFLYYVWDWFSNNATQYFEDCNTPFDNPVHLKFILEECVGISDGCYERDDTLFKKYF